MCRRRVAGRGVAETMKARLFASLAVYMESEHEPR
jgi:hypothetical protein